MNSKRNNFAKYLCNQESPTFGYLNANSCPSSRPSFGYYNDRYPFKVQSPIPLPKRRVSLFPRAKKTKKGELKYVGICPFAGEDPDFTVPFSFSTGEIYIISDMNRGDMEYYRIQSEYKRTVIDMLSYNNIAMYKYGDFPDFDTIIDTPNENNKLLVHKSFFKCYFPESGEHTFGLFQQYEVLSPLYKKEFPFKRDIWECGILSLQQFESN
jgi:hypothetical protein